MRKLLAAVCTVAIVIAAACSKSPSKPHNAEAKPPAPKTIGELRAEIAKSLDKYHVPGCGFALVARDHVIYSGGVGQADIAAGRDVTADTMFRIGSITKGFVALSLLQLHEAGKVDLNARVHDLAPEVEIVNPWEATDPVRLANLLEHTAGFDDFPLAEFYDFSGGPPTPLEKVFEMFPGPQHVRWRPGTFGSYSNPGYGLAGYILEKISGTPCEVYIADHILRPLKMAHSDLRLTPEVKAALAVGYEDIPPEPVPYLPIYLRPAGEMKSSPNEMARFVMMMLNRGTLDGVKIVSPDSIARMETPQTGLAASAGLKYGYGLGNGADLGHPFIAHGHDGGLDGFISGYEYIPDQGVGYFFSTNASPPLRLVGGPSGSAAAEIKELLFAYMTRDLKPPPAPPAVPLDSAVAQWAGYYELASPRQEQLRYLSNVVAAGWNYIDDGRLYSKSVFPGNKVELVFLGNNQFRLEKEFAAGGVYCADRDGTKYGCGTLACFRRANPWWPITRLILLIAALLAMLTTILFALVWIPRKVFGRMKGVGHLSVRIAPLIAAIVFIAAQLSVPSDTIRLATFNWQTGLLCFGTIAFAMLSVVSLILAIRSFSFAMNRAARIHSLIASLGCCGLTWYLAYWGIIGVRTWAAW